MKRSVILSLLAVAVSGFAQGGAAFRYDDNQNPEIWSSLADVFRKHNVRFDLSLNLGGVRPGKWADTIRSLQKEGFEVMDHTPNHQVLSYRPETPEKLKEYSKAPFVDHADSTRIYFKTDPGKSTFGAPFTVSVSGGNLLQVTPELKKEINPYRIYRCPDNGALYFVKIKNNETRLVSIWNEDNVKLPDGELKLESSKTVGFKPVPGSLEFLIERTREACRKLNLRYPTVWIQPGGKIPSLEGAFVAKACGKNSGYVSAATYPNSSMKGFHDPDPERSSFAIMWGDFNLEDMNLPLAKKKIADAVALHRIAIGASHVIPARKNKMPEYLKLHDELLAWLAEQKIPVKHQSEWARILAETKLDPKQNIMPSLNTDRNADGIPDGYDLNRKNASAEQGVITVRGNGHVFSINRLCGLSNGENILVFEAKGTGLLNLNIRYLTYGEKFKDRKFSISLNSPEWKKVSFRFDIPFGTAGLNMDCRVYGHKQEVQLKNFELSK